MDYSDKNKDELIKILHQLEKENNALKLSLQKDNEDTDKPNELFTNEDSSSKHHIKNAARAELLYNSILEASPDVITLTDLEGHIILTSNNAYEMFGYDHSYDYSNKSILEFLDPCYWEKALSEISNIFNRQSPMIEEYTAIKADGSSFVMEVKGDLVKDTVGNPVNLIFICRDVSERKRLNEQLIKSDESLRNIVENVNEAIYEIDEDGIVKYITPSIEKLSGFSPKEIIGKSLGDFAGIHSKELFEKMAVLKKDNTISGEYDFEIKNGEKRWFKLSSKAVFKEGKFIGITGIISDINEKKKIEDELEKSEEKYRTLVENVNDVIFSFDEEGIITYISKRISKVLGYTAKEIIGSNFLNFTGDYAKSMEDRFDAIKNRKYIFNEFELNDKHGNLKWIRISVNIQYNDNDEKFSGGYGVLSDITEKKKYEYELAKSEKQYRRVVESINDVVFETSGDGLIRFISPACKKVLGYKEKELTGKKIQDFVHPEDIDVVSKIFNIKTGVSSKIFEFRFLHKNDGYRWVRISVAPTINENSLSDLFGTITDIHNQKNIEENLKLSEIRYKSFFERNTSVILILNRDTGEIVDANEAASQYYGWSRKELCSMKISQINELSYEEIKKSYVKAENEGRQYQNFVHRLANGEKRNVEVYSSSLEYGGEGYFYEIIHDVTEAVKGEKKIAKSNRLRSVMSNINLAIIQEKELDILLEKVCQIFVETGGFRMAWMGSLIGDDPVVKMLTSSGFDEGYLQQADGASVEMLKKDLCPTVSAFINENIIVYNDFENNPDNRIWVSEALKRDYHSALALPVFISDEIFCVLTIYSQVKGFFNSEEVEEIEKVVGNISNAIEAIKSDIERKHAEESLAKINRLMMVISSVNLAIIMERNIDSLLKHVCNIVVESGKFQMAWIGIVDESTNIVVPTIVEGENNGYLENTVISKDDIPEGRGPIGKALRDAKPVVCNDIKNDPQMVPWRDEALKRNYRSCIALPIMYKEQKYGVLAIYSNIIGFFNEEEISILLEVVNNISNAVESIISENERKRVESELHKLSKAVEQSPVSIVITDKEGTIEYANPKTTETCGYSLDELIGQNPRILKSGETSDAEYQKMWKIICSGNEWQGYFHNKRKSGELYWESAYISPVLNEEGKITHFIAVKEDITEKKHTDEEIHKLSVAVMQSPVGVLITDINGTIEFANKSFLEMEGYTIEDILGKNTRILKSGQNDESVYVDLWETILKGEIWENEWIESRKNGELFWEHITITPIFNEKGEIINFLATKQDITQKKIAEQKIMELNLNLEQKIDERTHELAMVNKNLMLEMEERKRTQEMFSIAFHSSPSLISIAYLDGGQFFDVNETFLQKTGYTREEVIGHSANELNIFKDIHLRDKIVSKIKKKVPIRDWEIDFYTKYGEEGTILFSAETITINDQKCMLSVAIDITERKHADEAIRKARIDAEEANKAKSEFLSRMSHELRTPMNSILGFAQLLELSELNMVQKKGVNYILKSGKHLLNLINEVLDISKIEAGKMTLSIEPIYISEVVNEMLNIVRPMAEDNNVSLRFLDYKTTKLFVKSDRQSLKQIILNLVNNAIKYNKDGGSVEVSAKLIHLNENITDEYVRISIKDTGVGIPESDIKKLFTPFERVGALKTEVEGTGLGLAVVKKLLDVMGGKVGVESAPGKGSTFWFDLPRAEGQLHMFDGTEFEYTKHSIHERSATILYIEDNMSNVELVDQILSHQRPNIKLISSPEGLKAVKLSNEYLPDIILLDLNLSDIHGSEVLKRLRINSKTTNTPVIVISADAMPRQIENLLKSGANKYLTKPLDVNEFIDALDEFLKFSEVKKE